MYKNLIYLISLVLVLSIASTVSAELVAHWQFDDGSGTVAVDSTGNGHDGTLLLDPVWAAGKYGGALEFAGITGQRVEIEGYDGILGTQNRTVMAWVKTTELGDWISWGQNVNTQKWIGRFNDNEGNGQVGALRTECSGGYIISSTVLNDGEWHHVTSVLESDGSPTIEDISMYVDGSLETISGVRLVDVNTVGGRNVWIGDGHHDRPLMSVIDDVRIYDNAMTKLEIVAAKENIERVDMEIGFAMLPPVIDGEVDDIWAVTSTQNFVPLDDPVNASGSWKVLYDSENLYVLVDMTDDVLQNDSSSSWQDDSVEVYFDGGNTKLDTPLSGDDHQYTFGWTTDEIQGTNINGYTEGIEHAQVDTGTGWRIEIKMPWQAIQGAAPQAGDLIGIDCYYNDDDDGGDSRENKLLSFSVVEGWNDASQWATAVLADIPEPVDPGADGLVAHWPFDEGAGNTATDLVGGHDGTLKGGVAWAGEGAPGNGDSLSFDGYSDGVAYTTDPGTINWVSVDPFDVFGSGITLTAWIRPDGFDISDARIITKQKTWSSSDIWWMLSTYTDGTALRMRLKTDDGGADNGTTTMFSDTGYLEAGVWSQVAATYDGKKMRLYHNALEIMSTDKTGTIQADPAVAVAIGNSPLSDPGGLRAPFHGLIDDVRIYERALSESELLYLAGFRAKDEMDPSLVIYYSFDEVGDIVADQSGKGHDGTVVGDVTAEAEGMIGGAANFASGGYLDLDGANFPSEDIPTSAMTLAAWIKIANTGGDHEIFNARASDETWIMHPEPKSSGDIRWLLRSYGGTTIFQIRTGVVTWDQWLHFAGTYDKESGMAALYINGELIEEMVVENPADIAGDWGLGARVGKTIDDARPFTGLMDELRMYTRALSQDEILEVMQGM